MPPTLTLPRTPRPAPDWMRQIQITSVQAELVPTRPWVLPEDPDLVLRSALGRAVFDLLCVRPQQHCRACDLRDSCELPGWYDPGRIGGHSPRPVLPVSVSSGGQEVCPASPWRVGWWVLGPLPRPSLLEEAIVRMARQGLGSQRVPHRVGRLMIRGEGGLLRLMEDEVQEGRWPPPGPISTFVALPSTPTGAEVQVFSPFQSREGEGPPTVAGFLRAAIGRLRQVARTQGQRVDHRWPEPPGEGAPWPEAHWVPAERRASGGGTQDLSGWTGAFRLGSEVADWADLLGACEILGVGPGVGAGRGRYRVIWEE